jgi:hypothetical protein
MLEASGSSETPVKIDDIQRPSHTAVTLTVIAMRKQNPTFQQQI